MTVSHWQRREATLSIITLLAGLILNAGIAVADSADKGADIFKAARQALAGGRVAKTSQVGFSIEKKPFSDAPAEGALLVGFDVGLGKSGKEELIYSLQPIYRSAQGESSSEVLGLVQTGSPSGANKKPVRKQVTRGVRLQANSGYAVGAITLRTTIGIRGMSLTFMRIQGQTLDPKQSTTSDWAGDDKSGRESVVSGNGAPIIGVFGNQDEQQVLALGLIYINDGKTVASIATRAQTAPQGIQPERSSTRVQTAPKRTQPARADARSKMAARLEELIRQEEAAPPTKETENAAPAAPQAQEIPATGNDAAPDAPVAGLEKPAAEIQVVPWQRWQILGLFGVASLVGTLILLVSKGRARTSADPAAASGASPKAGSALRSAGARGAFPELGSAWQPTTPEPQKASAGKVINLIVGLAVGLAAAVIGYQLMSGKSGGSQSFREFTSEEGKFKVEMPGSPSRETVSAAGLTMISFQIEEKDGAYGVAYADIPMLGGASSALVTRALDSARDNMVRKVNGKFTGESRISLDGKFPGREIRADIPEKNGLIKGRLYLVKDRVYMVMVVGLPGWVNSANAKRFLDSLDVTK